MDWRSGADYFGRWMVFNSVVGFTDSVVAFLRCGLKTVSLFQSFNKTNRTNCRPFSLSLSLSLSHSTNQSNGTNVAVVRKFVPTVEFHSHTIIN